MVCLITGGSCSGKSTYAERLVSSLPAPRIYLATMQVLDEESMERVKRHREQRKHLGFSTIECPMHLSALSLPPEGTVLLEDLPNLLANEMFSGGNPELISDSLRLLSQKCRHLIIVTNEVFSSAEAYDESTQDYIRKLADISRNLSQFADNVIEVVYGIPICLKGKLPC